jgi:hypothetical protein
MAHRCSCAGPSPTLITGASPLPSTSPPPPRSAVGTHLSDHLNPRQGDQLNRLVPLELLPNLWTTASEPPCRNTATVVELYRRRLGSPSFYPLRSTPTITSPPARFPLVPWSFLASSPSLPATTVAEIGR